MITLKISFEARFSILNKIHLREYDDFRKKITKEEIRTIEKANLLHTNVWNRLPGTLSWTHRGRHAWGRLLAVAPVCKGACASLCWLQQVPSLRFPQLASDRGGHGLR